MAIKAFVRERHPAEAEISQMFSLEPLASDPQNHSIPVFEVLQSSLKDGVHFMIMPYLLLFQDVRFESVGEVMDCFKQLFEVRFVHSGLKGLLMLVEIQGLQFIHNHHVAHR